jgi:hypothetical protein
MDMGLIWKNNVYYIKAKWKMDGQVLVVYKTLATKNWKIIHLTMSLTLHLISNLKKIDFKFYCKESYI